MRSLGIAAVAVAVAVLWAAPAQAAGPLAWSSPVRIDRPNSFNPGYFAGPVQMGQSSCPSTSLCVAVDALGNVLTSTDPTGGFGAWTAASVDTSSGSPNQLAGVSCSSPSLCVAVDSKGNVVTSTNPTGGSSAWAMASVDGGIPLDSVSCPSASLCVAVGGEVVTSTNPTGGASAWTGASVDGTNVLSSVSCPSVSLCVAVDNKGDVVTSTDPTGGAGAWTVTNVDGANLLTGVSCPSASLCVAVDEQGNVVTSADPTAGAGAWTVANVDSTSSGPNSFGGVACPSASLCVAVDDGGNVVSSTDPTGGASAWSRTRLPVNNGLTDVACASASLCLADDNPGNVVTSTNPTGGATAWSVSTIDTSGFVSAVSCASASVCVAADDGGNVVTSADPAGGASAWDVANLTAPEVGGASPSAVSCASESLCVAVGTHATGPAIAPTPIGSVLTSPDPTGGPSAWTVADVETGSGLNGVSCPSASFCVAVGAAGEVVTSTDPTGGPSAWTAASVGGGNLEAVSCPSSSLCVAVGAAGEIVTSTDPTGGASAWTAVSVAGAGDFTAVSCPTASLCVAVDGHGDVVTSTDPTGGAGAWSVADVDGFTSIGGVSCGSPSLCVAVDPLGNVLTSTDPTGGVSAWSTANVDGTVSLVGVSCPSASLCVAIDGDDNALVGTAQAPVVTSTGPANGATGVPADANVYAVFSEGMNESSTAGAFSVTDDTTGVSVPGSVSWYGNVVPVFTPAGGYLHPGDRYTATISTAAMAQDGTPVGSPISWSFTVSADPVVVATSPGAGASGVYPNQPIVTLFSQPMNEQATQAAFSLENSSGNPVAGSFSWYGPTAMIFVPSANLSPGASYMASVSTAATDQSGNALAQAKSWSFTATAQPVIDAVSPGPGATGVSPRSPVVVFFSQAMDQRSVAGALSLTQTATGARVAGSVAWYTPQIAIFLPAAALSANTSYTASVGGSAANLAGDQLADPTSWSFTTGGASATARRLRALTLSDPPANGKQAGTVRHPHRTGWDRLGHQLPPAVRLPHIRIPQPLNAYIEQLQQRLRRADLQPKHWRPHRQQPR